MFTFSHQSLFARLGAAALSVTFLLLGGLLYYLSYRSVAADNQARLTTATLTSQALVDKLDRNFYERFGDVQAFAYNRLAVQAARTDSTSAPLIDFMNTMTSYYVLYDLMMIVNLEGNVVAVNTKDKKGFAVNTAVMQDGQKNFLHEDWFKTCVSEQGPEGGAWYSDFMQNPDVAEIHNNTGYGMGFAAPIRDDAGKVIGVWYNFANWQEITQTIRREVEAELQKSDDDATVLLTNSSGEIIDASTAKLVASAARLNEKFTVSGERTLFNPAKSYTDYVSGWASAHGAYTYKGKGWKAVTLLGRTKVGLAHMVSGDMLPVLLTLLLVITALSWVTVRFFRRNIIYRIDKTREILEHLAAGELAVVPPSLQKPDELGKMALSLGHLTQSVKHKVDFSNEIARGNLQSAFEDVSENDVLGQSLLNMRNQLQVAARDAKQRTWVSEGIAQAADIIRVNAEMHELSMGMLAFLVRYLDANQGGVFVKAGEGGETVLEMTACYAYNRKKHLEKTIRPGEGLLGQTFLEAKTTYLTNLPDRHTSITSGLGESTPRCLLVVPLLYDQRTEGVLELASYEPLEPFQIEFVEKVCENLAAALRMAQTNRKTNQLLAQSQEQAELLRAQEEEMRQNVEEMAAIQEEMQRKERDYQRRIGELEQAVH